MGKNSAAREARRARADEEAREARIKTGSADIRKMFADKFNTDYYNTALQEQKDQYTKGFESQWETARQGLEAALMRAGLYDSTEGATRMQKARDEKGDRQLEINSRAQAAVQGRKANVLAAEDAVLGQLRSSGDTNAANATAAQQLQFQSEPIPFSPLGSVFTDFTAGLATQAEQERQGTNRYNLGVSNLFNNGSRYTSNVRG